MDENKKVGTLYLIPTPLSGQNLDQALTQYAREVIFNLSYFIVENAKTARAFLKTVNTKVPLQQLVLDELNEHTNIAKISVLLAPILNGQSCGVLSETGVPCLADPGSNLVALAHKNEIEVFPLVGPSSILMSLISSGLSGQNFSFCGYLPAKSPDREIFIKKLEQHSRVNRQAQFFIETPYRAQKLLIGLLDTCSQDTRISLGVDLGSPNAWNKMKTVKDWKKHTPNLDGKLVVFGLEA